MDFLAQHLFAECISMTLTPKPVFSTFRRIGLTLCILLYFAVSPSSCTTRPGVPLGSINDWNNISPTVESRLPRQFQTAANLKDHHMMVYGGTAENLSIALGDTWLYDYESNTWAELHPSTSPSPRLVAASTGMLSSTSVLLFGGLSCLCLHLSLIFHYDPSVIYCFDHR